MRVSFGNGISDFVIDTLEGTNLNNTIRGGLGIDYLDGKAGADTYLFNRGDGQDTLYDSSYNDNSVDQLVFSGTGLTSTNAIVTRLGNSNDLKISFSGGISDSIILKNQVYSTNYSYGVESIKVMILTMTKVTTETSGT